MAFTYSRGGGFNEVDILGNTIHDNQDYGIYLRSYATYAGRSVYRIENNEIHRSGTGVYCWAAFSGMTVSLVGNQIHGGSKGIYCYSDDEYGRTSAAIDALIADNDIYDNSSEGILCQTNGGRVHPQIRANRIYSNGGDGIRTVYSRGRALTPVITLNEIYDNSAGGINCQASAAVDVFYNDIRNNAGMGLYLAAGNGSRVHFNNLHGNGGAYDLQNGNGSSINAQFNYWSAAAGAQMQAGGNPKNIARLYDIYDDTGKGTVYYGQWLSEPVVLTGTIISDIISPVNLSAQKNRILKIEGIAESPLGVSFVEVSADAGLVWEQATGTRKWHYDWQVPADGDYTLYSRAVYVGSGGDLIELPAEAITVTVDSSLPTTSGSLTKDEIWSGQVLLTGDVTVPAGVTLTIAAGTMVRFLALNDDQGTGANGSRAELIVNGALAVQGTADQPVVLTSAATDPQPGDWYGLRLVANAHDTSLSLSHCTVEYSSLGIRVEADGFDAALSLANSTIQQSAGDGIHMTGKNGAQMVLDVRDSTIAGHNGHGVYAFKPDDNSRLSGRIVDSTIGNNGGHGIYLFKGGGTASMRWISSATPSTTIRITGFI